MKYFVGEILAIPHGRQSIRESHGCKGGPHRREEDTDISIFSTDTKGGTDTENSAMIILSTVS